MNVMRENVRAVEECKPKCVNLCKKSRWEQSNQRHGNQGHNEKILFWGESILSFPGWNVSLSIGEIRK